MMPFFDKYNCIFIHIPKNAGRSIEELLLDESGSANSGRRSRANRLATYFLRKTSSPIPKKHLIGTLDYTISAQHLTLAEIELLNLVSVDRIANCLKFCVVRNPYDRMISLIRHYRKHPLSPKGFVSPPDPAEFERAIDKWFDLDIYDHNRLAHSRTQYSYTINSRGTANIDVVLRYESLSQDFEKLAAQLGINASALPHVGQVKQRVDYRDLYTAASRQKVEHKFAEDLDYFEYVF